MHRPVGPARALFSFSHTQGIQLYNLSFHLMATNMFRGERTAKQLKRKYEKEMRDHPDMVHRALRAQITQGEACRGARQEISLHFGRFLRRVELNQRTAVHMRCNV